MIKSYKDGQSSNSQPAAKNADSNPKVLVAIIDSGIDMKAGNGSISSKVVKRYLVATNEAGNPVEKDDPEEQDAFTGEDNAPSSSASPQPNYPGHATPIAFLIKSIAPNVDFLSIRVCNKYGDCNPGNVDRAIAYALNYADNQKDGQNKPKYKRGDLLTLVINLSLARSPRFDALYNPDQKNGSIVQAINRGAVVVAAGGGIVPDNTCTDASEYKYPAADGLYLDGLIGVGGLQWNINKKRWEKIVCGINAGNIELWAPGRQVISLGSRLDQGSYFYWFDGSSFATALVSGAIARLMSKNPALTPAELEACLKNNAKSKMLFLETEICPKAPTK